MTNSSSQVPLESNIQKEANSLGVRVTSSKTFLTFDEKGETEVNAAIPNSVCLSKRRFTTNGVISGELFEQFACSDIKNAAVDSRATPVIQEEVVDNNVSMNTTVMIRNVPNRFTQDELIMFFRESGFKFNFFYCPIDFRNRCNIGYFFINLTTNKEASLFIDELHGYQLPAYRSTKVCVASWARIQGYSQNVEHYINSPIIHMGREFRPRVFDLCGEETTFPGQLPLHSIRKSLPENTRKLFVGGIAPATNAESITSHLSQFGEIENVSIILDSMNKSSRGFAFVTFKEAESVGRCTAATDSHFIDGRCVGIRAYTSSIETL